MDKFLIILGLLLFVITIYLGTYLLNKKVKAPEAIAKADCSTCHSPHCAIRDEVDAENSDECDYDKE